MKNIFLTLLISLTTFQAFAIDPIDKAVENPSRTADDKLADERRHPKELLKFSKVKRRHGGRLHCRKRIFHPNVH